jgi:uncharacterized alkaline shock family protein YloU
MENGTNPLGNIYISPHAIASIAYHSLLQSYGVVGLAAKNLAQGIAQAFVKDPNLGIDVNYDGKSIKIDLYIIIEYGTRIKMVAATAAHTIKYQIENITGLPVSQVNVHVRGLHISNRD